jgi:hypothetical protein
MGTLAGLAGVAGTTRTARPMRWRSRRTPVRGAMATKGPASGSATADSAVSCSTPAPVTFCD